MPDAACDVKLFSSGSLCLSSSVLALTAFDGSVCHGGSDQADGTDSVIVAGDHVIDLVGIAVGINDSHDGNVQLAGLSDSVALLAGVNDEQIGRASCRERV